MRGLCPRCDSETLVLGDSTVETANKRHMRVSMRHCPKCGLVFYETT